MTVDCAIHADVQTPWAKADDGSAPGGRGNLLHGFVPLPMAHAGKGFPTALDGSGLFPPMAAMTAAGRRSTMVL
jgi:hypothetical protein